jgi:hypothetical protein
MFDPVRNLLRYNLWFEHDVVAIGPEKYLERWFMYFLGFTIRLHKFYRGDDDRAPHDHPWAFVTFPLGLGYWEQVFSSDGSVMTRYVAPWRWHWRPAKYQHIVLGTHAKADKRGVKNWTPKPFYTIVLTSRKKQTWGFYPEGKFVYWKDFNASR